MIAIIRVVVGIRVIVAVVVAIWISPVIVVLVRCGVAVAIALWLTLLNSVIRDAVVMLFAFFRGRIVTVLVIVPVVVEVSMPILLAGM